MCTRKRKGVFHEGTIFKKGAGLKKTNKGPNVLWRETREQQEL